MSADGGKSSAVQFVSRAGRTVLSDGDGAGAQLAGARPAVHGFDHGSEEPELDGDSVKVPKGLSNRAKGWFLVVTAVVLAVGGAAWWLFSAPLEVPSAPHLPAGVEEAQNVELKGEAVEVFAEFASRGQGKFLCKDISSTSAIPLAETGLRSAIPSMLFEEVARAAPDDPHAFKLDFGISWFSKKLIARTASHLVHLTVPMTISSDQLQPGQGVQKVVLSDGQACYMYRMFMRRDDDPENLGNWVDPMDVYEVRDLGFFYNQNIPWKAKGQTVGDLNMGMYAREGRMYSRQVVEDARKAVEDTMGSLNPSAKHDVPPGAILSEADLLEEVTSVLESTIARMG